MDVAFLWFCGFLFFSGGGEHFPFAKEYFIQCGFSSDEYSQVIAGGT